jgi:hypothetical protein
MKLGPGSKKVGVVGRGTDKEQGKGTDLREYIQSTHK